MEVFSGSSLGQHTRHIIEFFDCLVRQTETGKINYDLRTRNKQIETQTGFALSTLAILLQKLKQIDLDMSLMLEQCYDFEEDISIKVETTFARELVYNIEHAIHHLAIIKIGLRQMNPGLELPEGFGVAPSTIRHQRVMSDE